MNRPTETTRPRCTVCGDCLTVWWRGRLWCVVCDAPELFGDDDSDAEGGER